MLGVALFAFFGAGIELMAGLAVAAITISAVEKITYTRAMGSYESTVRKDEANLENLRAQLGEQQAQFVLAKAQLARNQKMIETNSLQLVKLLARGGDYVAFTSELDAAPEILANTLTFVPVRDKGAEPQTVSLAIDSRKPLSKIAKIVAEQLSQAMDDDLEQVRQKLRGRMAHLAG